jgi:formylglycine-generating enzyme required for sulfatase activity
MEKVIEAVIKALVDNSGISIPSLSAVVTTLGGILVTAIYKRIQVSRAAKDLAPYFSKKDVQQRLRLFIESKWQNNSPTREEEPLFTHKFVSKSTLIPHFIKTAFNENKVSDKFYLVLADSGMGKTTFMINLYVRYNSVFNTHKKYKIKLIPFGYQGNVIEKIKEIKKEEIPNTILLLDAFDEYPKILPPTDPDGLTDDKRFRQVLDEVIETVQDFREVVITSRTQYFPGEEDQPYELKIPTFDNKGFHTLAKFYLSPFDDKEIRCYLNKKYGILRVWNHKKKQKAWRIVRNSPKLMVRPMLLSYIDYLVDGDQHYANTYDIYDALINKWIEREGDKREHQHVNREKLKLNLHKYSQLVAVKIYEKRKETNSLRLCKADATDVEVELKDYQMTGQSLLTRDVENNWKFAHKSILEFFLAKEALENIEFAKALDFTGMDMARQFWIEYYSKPYPVVYVKGGTFLMGSPSNDARGKQDEAQHSVKIFDFFCCKYAVTVAQFNEFAKEAGIQPKAGKINHPVVDVSWEDADAYSKWIAAKTGKKFRLPTEAEWEYACRSGTTTPFNTGTSIITSKANYDGKGTVAVDSFAPNDWGLYNMHGNVWEWCNDWYGNKYYDDCNAKGTVEDPLGPETGSHRVLRGGSWRDAAECCRSAYRSSGPPGNRSGSVGFRLVFVP